MKIKFLTKHTLKARLMEKGYEVDTVTMPELLTDEQAQALIDEGIAEEVKEEPAHVPDEPKAAAEEEEKDPACHDD